MKTCNISVKLNLDNLPDNYQSIIPGEFDSSKIPHFKVGRIPSVFGMVPNKRDTLLVTFAI